MGLAVAGSLPDGAADYVSKDYAKAYKLLKPLAELGVATGMVA